MILTELADRQEGPRRRISMDLVWEDSPHPRETLYFAADGEAADLMRPSADAFAIACLPLAVGTGERRLRVEDTLCTRLRSGLRLVNQVFHEWYPRCSLVALEATGGFAPTRPPERRRVASLLSGGVDGLMTLRRNRLDYPLDHPESIRACITLFGVNKFDVTDGRPVPERLDAFAALLGRLGELAREEHFRLLPVRTNVRSLAPSYAYWTAMGFGAGHSAVAQLFQGHFDKVLFASNGDGPNPPPGAAHPVFNPHFSTDAVRIQGEQDEMRRSEKLELLTRWELARRLMQPCHYVRIPEGGRINCGRCEKCVRDMLTLIGLGRLRNVSAFAEDDLTPDRLFRIPLNNRRKAALLLQSIPGLRQAGRRDLAWAIRARVALFHLLRT
ncbi:MAG TPA: hypothetical protein VMT16_11035 [Thermoanaerobaculia bacterium]|nr:hypothetical protein [Thermoanaerobaculia bacterium]